MITKTSTLPVKIVPRRSDGKTRLKQWQKVRGIWKGRKIPDPVVWQRQIRTEWDRPLP